MTGEEVLGLLPKLTAIAVNYESNGVDREDLFQEAVLDLLRRPKVRDPILYAGWAMRKYRAAHGYRRFQNEKKDYRLQRIPVAHLHQYYARHQRKDSAPENRVPWKWSYGEEKIPWHRFGLTRDEKRAAVLYFDRGLFMRQVGRRMGYHEVHIGRLLKRVAKKARTWAESWV